MWDSCRSGHIIIPVQVLSHIIHNGMFTASPQTFGAMLSCQLKISEHYYGTGESFLFKFKPNETEGTLELKVI